VAEEKNGAGLRLGIGTDITGGIAYGGEINYNLVRPNGAAFEMALMIFGGSFEETTEEAINTYVENTDVFAVAAVGNYLFNYAMEKSGPYFVAGVGVGAFSVDWEESSTTDTSLGTPLPGGGSKQDESGTAGGMILNFGIGGRFSEKFDLRFSVPTFFLFGTPGEAAGVVPTFTLTAGLRF